MKKESLNKTIILLDGFDEVVSYFQTGQPEDDALKGIANEIQYYNIIITSRPNAV